MTAPVNMTEADFGLLVALQALFETNNVTRAAAQLGLSQPALSARLQRLRHLFEDPLFVPAANGRGVVPTPRALDLKGTLSEALRLLRALTRASDAFDPDSSRRTFTLAMQEQPAASLAPNLVASVLARAPGVHLAFVYPGRDIGDRLEDGSVDLLVAPAQEGGSALMTRALFATDFLTAQRKDHPRGTARLSLESYCSLDHLVVSTEGGGFTGLVDRVLAGMGRKRRVALSIQSYGLAPLIVARTDCLCTLPGRLLRSFADSLDLFEPPLAMPSNNLAALWHPRSQEDGGHIWLREQLYRAAEAAPDAPFRIG